MRWFALPILILLVSTVAILAQDTTCPAFEQNAIVMTGEVCSELEAEQVCYGHPTVTAGDLNAPGERVDIMGISQIRTTKEGDSWGVAQILTSVYPENSWQSQSMSLVVFGDVLLTPQGNEGVSIPTVDAEITISQGANIRTQPSAEAALIRPLLVGDSVKLTGRLPDNSWFRLQFPDGETGWVFAQAVDTDRDTLPVVDADDDLLPQIRRPLQDFDLITSVDDARCPAAPSSGVLLQTSSPGDLEINNVQVRIDGTVYLQSSFILHVLNGDATVIVGDSSQFVAEGNSVTVLVEGDGDEALSTGVSSTPQAYDYERLLPLPLSLLPEPAYVAVDLRSILTPRPSPDASPLEGMALDAPCRITVGPDGANLRSGPGTDFPVRGVIAYRESAEPEGRTIGTDGQPWWRLAAGVWLRVDTTVTGGDCFSVPNVDVDG